MPLCAIIDKSGFEAWFDTGNDCFVNIAFFLFFRGRFDVEINELLTIDDRDTQFFGLCRVKQHSFHKNKLPRTHGKALCSNVNYKN